MPKIKPILFNTEMVKAILNGHKTETRRIIKPIKLGDGSEFPYSPCALFKPPYDIGDHLYVRETWTQYSGTYGQMPTIIYKADGKPDHIDDAEWAIIKWKPSIHMPKSIARLFLRVESIRAERLRDIDIFGLRREGLCSLAVVAGDEQIAREEFAKLWDSTTSEPGNKWMANPYVWVIRFKVQSY